MAGLSLILEPITPRLVMYWLVCAGIANWYSIVDGTYNSVKGLGSPVMLIEFNAAPAVPPVPVISKVTSAGINGAVELPVGITSGQVSSLHSKGAVKTFGLLNVQAPSAEKVAVKSIAPPSAGKTTLVKV